MCKICRSFPCRPQCPNAEPIEVYTCDLCEEPIYDGDTYYRLSDDLCACEDCVQSAKRTAEAL